MQNFCEMLVRLGGTDIYFSVLFLKRVSNISQIKGGIKVRKMANIRKRYNQVPHLTQDTAWESSKKIKIQ